MIRTIEQVEESFLNNVSNHSMKVLQDNGVYRHLEFSNNGSSNQKFSLVTYPHHLVFSGDMGAYVFSRIQDMFEFFRNKELGINPYYWSQKVEAVSKGSGINTFDSDLVMKSIKQRINSICHDIEEYFDEYEGDEYETAELFEAAFRDEVTEHFDDADMDEYRYISVIDGFKSEVIKDLEFIDSGEWINGEAYSSRYLWCCYAMVWGIQQYDKERAKADYDAQFKVMARELEVIGSVLSAPEPEHTGLCDVCGGETAFIICAEWTTHSKKGAVVNMLSPLREDLFHRCDAHKLDSDSIKVTLY